MLISGKEIAEKIYTEIGNKLKGKRVCFVSFLESPESKVFMERKQKVAERLGVTANIKQTRAEDTNEAVQIVREIVQEGYDGVVVQLPLPTNFDAQKLFDTLPIELDIDMLGTEAKHAYIHHQGERTPPVAGALEEILKHHEVKLVDKKIVLLGKGCLVGEPVSLMLWRSGAHFSNFDINTPEPELLSGLREADIVISGIGSPHFIKPNMIKPGVVLIDAGTSEQAGKLAGDIDPGCADTASLYTPVPGGVGPLTIATLMRNLC